MKQTILSPKAKSDLNSIWDYTADKRGLEQAETYIRELWDKLQPVSTNLSSSTEIDDIREGYRKIRSGSHVIFFKATEINIDVIRILHQRMDFDRHL